MADLILNPKTYQGKPCKWGHSGIRWISNYTCVECTKLWTKEWQQLLREKNGLPPPKPPHYRLAGKGNSIVEIYRGNPCKHGHEGVRYVSSRCCVECQRLYKKLRTQARGKAKREWHGMSNTPLYETWCRMKNRCFNINSPDYKHWGGRGITVCDRWRDSFMAFYEDVMRQIGPCPPGLSFDRIDNDGHYQPGNIRWANQTTQCRNRRFNFVKLTSEDAQLIRGIYARQERPIRSAITTLLADAFGVTRNEIWNVVTNKTWKE